MGTWLFFLFNGGGLRCCPFPAAWEKCSPLPQQTHQDRHCKHSFLCKGVQFSKNYVGQQFKLIGLTSHWHWCRGADMIYCRAELGGRKDGESNMVWCYHWCVVKNKWEHQVLQQGQILLTPWKFTLLSCRNFIIGTKKPQQIPLPS